MVDNGELCSCGQHGCLETLVSSRAVVKRVKELGKTNPQLLPPEFLTASDEVMTDILLKAYEDGHEAAHLAIQEAGLYMGKAVMSLASTLNIHRIVLAGSMARFGEGLLEPIREQVSRGVLPAIASETRVETSELGADIVILGAAALLLLQELGIS
jgi:N-acetylglucosamine repressor